MLCCWAIEAHDALIRHSAWRRWWRQVVSGANWGGSAFDGMNGEEPIEPLPEVAVLHGGHAAVTLPLPAAGPPLRQAIHQAAAHLPAAGHQRHPRRLLEGFQPPDDGEQLEPLRPRLLFAVLGFKSLVAIFPSEAEPPLAARRLGRISQDGGFRKK